MFNFFKKKVKKEDPILKEINRQTEELKAINDSIRRNNESLEADIQKAESLLLSIGYSQEDLEKLKMKSKLKVVKWEIRENRLRLNSGPFLFYISLKLHLL